METISGVDIGAGIIPCYMMQSSASAVGNIFMCALSLIVMVAAIGQVFMQVPNLFYVFSQADRVSLKATFRLVQRNEARLFVNEHDQYEIAMFNFDPNEERVRLRNE